MRKPIAITGLGTLFPGSTDVGGFWRDVLAAKDRIGDVPPSHWLIEDYHDANPAAKDRTYAKRGGFLPRVPFDPVEWGITPNSLPATDAAQLLALIVAQQTLEDAARGPFKAIDRERMSVILGVAGSTALLAHMAGRMGRPMWRRALVDAGLPEEQVDALCDRIADQYVPWQESTFPGLLPNVVAGRIANRLNLGGTNCTLDAACASSFAALSMAMNELEVGQSDLVLTGGVDALNDIVMYMCFSKTPALSPSGDCRPFSDQADGTMIGEGLAMLALRRLEDAERDGDRVYAVIKGVGSSSDGRAKSVYAPRPEGQALALRRAYAAAGYGPDTVELVEGHGTGTKAGDVAEVAALRTVFDETGRADRQWCALGSVKSQIGHTKAAAGMAGLAKAALALHHKVLPPTLKVERPNPALELDASPFYVSTQPRPWLRPDDQPRRASVSAFGFGGSNFHVTLEEYRGPAPAERLRALPSELVLLSADRPEALAEACRRGGTLARLAWTGARTFRADAPARLAIVAVDDADLERKLARAAEHLGRAPATPLVDPTGIYVGLGATAGALAFLFPGQGSQYLGMGADLAMAFEDARRAWDRAASVVRLDPVVFPRPTFTAEARAAAERHLTATEWAQPAIAAASLAQLALLERLGVSAAFAAGHSFGEVTALHAAGVLDGAALLRVARRRGELMAEAAATPGAMTAVAHPAAEVEALLAADVVIANRNSPRQTVVAGTVAAIEAIEERLRARGLTFRRLPVATAFHSPIVAGSSAPFRAFIGEVGLAAPALPVYSNAEAAPYPSEPEAIRARLAEQLARPVRFDEEIEALYAAGARVFVEVGPGATLTGLVGDCLRGRPHVAVALDRKGQNGVTSLWHGLGQLAAAGVALDAGALWAGFRVPAEPRPVAATAVQMNGANLGKPYPGTGDRRPVVAPPPLAAAAPPPRANGNGAANGKNGHAAPPPPPPPAPVESPPGRDWMEAHAEIQRKTAEAHTAFQQTMAETHLAFLRTAETFARSLRGDVVEAQVPVVESTFAPPPAIALSAAMVEPTWAAPPAMAPPPPLPGTAPPVMEPAPALDASAPAPTPAAPRDLKALLIDVVAEKTGYPADVLQLDSELEAGLGIDSIKRVEILAALKERAPGLPEVAPGDMARLRTLGDIVAFLDQHAASAAPAPPAPVAPAAPARDLKALLIGVVAEKTGYPADVLHLDAELEAGLGIDSIKRVEILAALKERAPGLPEVAPGDMARLRTLGDIVAFLDQHAAPATPAAPAPAPAAPARDLKALLIGVVAEKTGYPADVLRLDAELEAGLGIDSIKRVEILAALKERAPGLPEVAPDDMARLRTLGDIVEFLDRTGPAAAPAAPEPVAATPAAPAPAAPEVAPVERYRVVETAAPAAGFALPGLFDAPVVVVGEPGDVAAELCARLAARGVTVEVADEAPAGARGVVFLALGAAGFDEALATSRAAFHAAKAIAGRATLFVTVQDTGGDFGLAGAGASAWRAGIAALAKTAAIEWPDASVKAIDLEQGGRSAGALADALAAELLGGGPEREVGLHADGRRTTLACAPAPRARPGAPAIGPDSVVVASGGARGVTAASLIALARAARPKIALLGRTRLDDEPPATRGLTNDAALKKAVLAEAQARGEAIGPAEIGRRVRDIVAAREVRGTLAALEAAGATARYVPVDIQDGAAVAAALAEVRRELGPITALIHGAGVLADRTIADKTTEQFDLVLGTKVRGLRALLDATAADPLTAIGLFSSVAARAGNAGQCDYAMANEILNKVAAAEARRRGGCWVRALGWGPWAGGMVTPALEAHFKGRGVPLIALEAGAAAFVAELGAGSGDVEVVLGAALSVPAERAVVDVIVDAASHPYLESHRVKDVPVLPAVLVHEWFVRAAATLLGPGPIVCRDLKVLRGAPLPRFQAGHRFRIVCRRAGAGIACALHDDDGGVRYSATVAADAPLPVPAAAPPDLPPWPWRADEVYGPQLFHGPDFAAIRGLDGIDGDSATATLIGVRELGWSGGPFLTDPGLLDGGLQLARLWGAHQTGRPSLPTTIGSAVVHRRERRAGLVRCELAIRQPSRERTVSTIRFVDGDGLVAELHDVEMHFLPAP
jgi:acyl transferase domain-containing protein